MKLINKNGLYVEYNEIPDIWDIAMKMDDESRAMVLRLWHQANDMRDAIQLNEKAELVSCLDESQTCGKNYNFS